METITATEPSVRETRPILIGHTVEEIRELLAPFGQPSFRAEQVYKWIHHQQVGTFAQMSNLPKALRRQLDAHFQLRSLKPASRQISTDGTRRYLWQRPDGHCFESVFIPEEKRTTICISSQVGCALGCTFCATAKMGFIKNLTSGEIVEQVIRVREDTGTRLTNVVFMGMGEPFLNYARVIKAGWIMSDPRGLAIAAKKITISTVGIVPRIRQFTDEQQPFSLAISLHAPTQELRRRLMPIADKFPLAALMDSAHYYMKKQSRRRITFEYVLLAGVNDAPEQARGLQKLLAPLRCKLNLIPYNDTGQEFAVPDETRTGTFGRLLENSDFTVTIRKNRGNDIAAACGQLYNETNAAEQQRFMAHTAVGVNPTA